MAKFHISKDGTARPCNAQTPEKCTATPSDQKEHYDSLEEAQKAFESKAASNHKTLKEVKKNPVDSLENDMMKAKYNPEPAYNKSGYTVKPVLSNVELKREKAVLTNDLKDSGMTVKSVLNYEGINESEIVEADEHGIGIIYSEEYDVDISTDLARKELGLPKRKKTASDRTFKNRLTKLLREKDDELSKAKGPDRQKIINESTRIQGLLSRTNDDILDYGEYKKVQTASKDEDPNEVWKKIQDTKFAKGFDTEVFDIARKSGRELSDFRDDPELFDEVFQNRKDRFGV